MFHTLILAAALLQPAGPAAGPETFHSPFAGVELSLKDATALGSTGADLKHTRWLFSGHLPRAERVKLKKACDFALNSLSHNKLLIKTVALPGEQDPVLLRVDLKAYGIATEAWYELAEKGSGRVPLPEPYFHLTPFVKGTRKKQRADLQPAPWITAPDSGKTWTALSALTHSGAPILRSDWFVTYALWAPGYYRMLGIDPDKGTEEDLIRLANADLAKSKRALVRAIADTQIVTLENRILERNPTLQHVFGGYYWKSRDTDRGVDDEDYFLTLLRPTIKAQEIIFSLPNRLQGYALTDGQGKLLNVANPSIARDKRSRFKDAQVWAGFSCVVCHDDGGLWPIDDDVRKLAAKQIALISQTKLHGKDAAEALALNESFAEPLEPVLVHDRSLYTAAVLAVNGMTTKENAKLIEDVIVSYFDRRLTPADGYREAGFPDEASWRARLQKAVGLDHTAVRFLQTPPLAVNRLQWENQGYATMMLYLTGTTLPTPLPQRGAAPATSP